MKNPVAKHDHNRAAIHPDRPKRPQLTVGEGLLDYYVENAAEVAEGVYYNDAVTSSLDEISEEDMKTRTLRMNIHFSPRPCVNISDIVQKLSGR